MPPKNIFLVGFMASGKSSVGRHLARLLRRPFVDTDAEVERAAKRSVARIFSENGEEYFRRLEQSAVARSCRRSGMVVAVGGGAVTRPRNVALMKKSGTIVYLSAGIELLWSRARREGLNRRPLLNSGGTGRLRTMARLLALRRPIYRDCAHIVVRASGSPEQVAGRILQRLGER
jgi:shikimate kinase